MCIFGKTSAHLASELKNYKRSNIYLADKLKESENANKALGDVIKTQAEAIDSLKYERKQLNREIQELKDELARSMHKKLSTTQFPQPDWSGYVIDLDVDRLTQKVDELDREVTKQKKINESLLLTIKELMA